MGKNEKRNGMRRIKNPLVRVLTAIFIVGMLSTNFSVVPTQPAAADEPYLPIEPILFIGLWEKIRQKEPRSQTII